MNNKKLKFFWAISILLIGLNIFSPSHSSAYTSNLQNLNNNTENQLLRVSLNPSSVKNEVNINLFTSSSRPKLSKQRINNSEYIIELADTTIATTNNINLEKVSDLVSNVRLVPFINTDNPSQTGMTRIIINTKNPSINFNVVVKSISLSNNADNKVSSKIYYPPKAEEPNNAQNMAFYTPLDDSTTSNLPLEETVDKKLIAQDFSTIPEIPRNDTTKLEVSPPGGSVPPPLDDSSVQNLPDLGSPVTPAMPPAVSSNSTTQPVQSPQPPVEQPERMESAIPPNIAQILSLVCGLFIAGLITVAYIVVREIGKQKKNKAAKINNTNIEPNKDAYADLELLEEIEIESPVKADHKSHTSSTPVQEIEHENSSPFGEDIEEVDLIDSVDLNEEKTLYLVNFSDSIALIGLVNEEVTVLNRFAPHETPKLPAKIELKKEGTIVGKDIYHVKIGTWEAVLSSENGSLSLHTNLTS